MYRRCFLTILLLGFLASCSSNDPTPTPVYSVPKTYQFAGSAANRQVAALRLEMIEHLIDVATTANTLKTVVDETTLLNLYTNTGNPFQDVDLDKSGLTLQAVVAPGFDPILKDYIARLAAASRSTVPGTNGVAGVVDYSDPSRHKLNDANGYVPYELMEKGLMGALQYYQITNVLLDPAKIGPAVAQADKQKNWDLAFGYLGLPDDYSADTVPGELWAEYLSTNAGPLNNNHLTIMNAFLKGRAAIDNNDQASVDAAALTIRTEFDRIMAGMSLSYLKKAKAALEAKDYGRRNNAVSEGLGFLLGLSYNPVKKISDADLTALKGLIGTNNWTLGAENIQKAIDKLAGIYSFDAAKF